MSMMRSAAALMLRRGPLAYFCNVVKNGISQVHSKRSREGIAMAQDVSPRRRIYYSIEEPT